MIQTTRTHTFTGALYSAALAATAVFTAQSAWAQEPLRFETRVELEARAKSADTTKHSGEAYLARYRLEHGDFRDGDRIVIRVLRGSAGFSDTLVVRTGKKLTLPQMGDVSLEGVLRSELEETLRTHMAKFIRDPLVDANQLVRIGILGHVGRPGFYYAPADIPLTDVLMAAGGPTPIADLGRVTILRDGEVIVDRRNTRNALNGGLSMDWLHMQAGDEISVGKQRQTNWPMIISMTSGLVGLVMYFVRQ